MRKLNLGYSEAILIPIRILQVLTDAEAEISADYARSVDSFIAANPKLPRMVDVVKATQW